MMREKRAKELNVGEVPDGERWCYGEERKKMKKRNHSKKSQELHHLADNVKFKKSDPRSNGYDAFPTSH